MKQEDKQLIIVAVKGLHTQVIFGPAIPRIVQVKRSELIKSGNWKGYILEIRTPQGYANKKILKNAA